MSNLDSPLEGVFIYYSLGRCVLITYPVMLTLFLCTKKKPEEIFSHKIHLPCGDNVVENGDQGR